MVSTKRKRIDDLAEVSGKITYSDPLTTFFYLLLRNNLAAGEVESLVFEACDCAEEDVVFTNGWLAQYANNLSEQIRNAAKNKLATALEKAFDKYDGKISINGAKIDNQKQEAPHKPEEEPINEDDLSGLIKKMDKLEECGKQTPDIFSNVDLAKKTIKELKAEGVLKDEEADRLILEVEQVFDEESGDKCGGCGIECDGCNNKVIMPVEPEKTNKDEVVEKNNETDGSYSERAAD